MRNKGLILVFSTAIISGVSVFINKYGVSGINPYVFAFLKNVSVALVLSGFILLAREWRALAKLTKKEWILLVLIGFIGGGVAFLLFFKGLAMTSAASGSFIHKTMFIYTMALAAVFLREKIKKEMLIGALLLLAGNLLALKSMNISFGAGDLFILAATFLWAVENVISKYTLKNLSSKVVIWGRMFFGSALILGYLWLAGKLSIVGQLNFGQIFWIEITSLILFGYVLTWYSGLRYIPASVATAILLLGSPITTFLSFLSSGTINFNEIMSGLLIISGLAMILGFKFVMERFNRLKEKIYVRA